MPKEKVAMFVWDFPAQDFLKWKKLCADEDDFNTYAEYQASLATIEGMSKKSNLEVVRLKMPVTKFMVLLAQRGLENNSANRAQVLEEIGRQGYLSGEKGDRQAK